mmetsp:Transcript_72186/g.199081  ORF Transcript_72186/g.199081 Transcript_72186/m.199081 type:complete len:180 (-) Transcript_72186:767-1306(-)
MLRTLSGAGPRQGSGLVKAHLHGVGMQDRMTAFFSALLAFTSPGGQRWQRLQLKLFRQPCGFQNQAQGSQAPVPCNADPVEGGNPAQPEARWGCCARPEGGNARDRTSRPASAAAPWSLRPCLRTGPQGSHSYVVVLADGQHLGSGATAGGGGDTDWAATSPPMPRRGVCCGGGGMKLC